MNEGLFALLPMPFYWGMLILWVLGAGMIFIDWAEDDKREPTSVPDQKTVTVNRR